MGPSSGNTLAKHSLMEMEGSQRWSGGKTENNLFLYVQCCQSVGRNFCPTNLTSSDYNIWHDYIHSFKFGVSNGHNKRLL